MPLLLRTRTAAQLLLAGRLWMRQVMPMSALVQASQQYHWGRTPDLGV